MLPISGLRAVTGRVDFRFRPTGGRRRTWHRHLADGADRLQVRINGVSASVNSLSERLSVLWLTPAMDRLFVDSAGSRRRFLDRLTLALEPGHATHAARYEAAMRARNKLLAEPAGADASWLTALETGMAEHGVAGRGARPPSRTVRAGPTTPR